MSEEARHDGGKTGATGADGPDQPPVIPDHQLLRRIGRGSYGEVWLARSLTGAYRAVKIVRRSSFEDQRPYEREFDGIRKYEPISRGVDGAVDILHVGRAADATSFFYVMEVADDLETGQTIDPDRYIPRTLRAELRRRGRLPASECLEIGLALASALAALHQHHLVHRDVKPSNIVFVNGRVKLADIGLVTDSEHEGSLVGTEGYFPPEGPGNPMADAYSLGMVLFEALTGKDRQEFPSLPTDFRDLPDQNAHRHLNDVILRACHRDREERYATAEAMRQDLDRAANGHPPVPRVHKGQAALGRIAIGCGAVLLLVLAALALRQRWQKPGSLPDSPAPTAGTPSTTDQSPNPVGPHGQRLRLIRSFSSPLVPSWGTALIGCGNGDGDPEIFVTSEGRLFEFSMLGDELVRWKPPVPGAEDVRVALLANGNHDPCLEPFVSWRDRDKLFLSVINSNGGEFRRFTNRAAIHIQEDGRPADGILTAARLVDLESDGQLELLARLHTGAGRRTRGLCCYALTNGALRWFFPTAPNVLDVHCDDLDEDGVLDVVMGTQAPANGNREADGTDDAHTYLYGISGKTATASTTPRLWRVDLWDACSQAHVQLDRPRRAIYAWSICSGSDLLDQQHQRPKGEVIRVSYGGTIQSRYSIDAYLSGCTLVDRGSNQPPQFLAIDQSGVLHVLSDDLQLVTRWPIAEVTRGRAQVAFFGQSDLDGDGRPEHLMLCTEEEHVAGDNLGIQDKSPTVRQFHQVSVVVLDATYRPIARYLLATRMKNPPDITLWAGPIDAGQPNQILVLDKDVRVLELDSPKPP